MSEISETIACNEKVKPKVVMSKFAVMACMDKGGLN
jgi:hypothetical protein